LQSRLYRPFIEREAVTSTIGKILGTLLIAALVVPQLAHAQADYPSKTISFVVAYSAGGGADSRSRQISQRLAEKFGKPVIVENKPGAGGNIGTDFIARANPDGYTIGMGNFAPLAVNKALFGKLSYDPQNDLVPIVAIEQGPLVLCVPADSPFKSVADIVKAAKAKPGYLTFASGGIGGTHHLSGELFKQAAGIDMIHVPYKGGSGATTDLLGGQVQMMFEQMYSALPNIKAGKIRPLAITSARRSSQLPETPTFAEAGYPKVVVNNWQGLVAPKGTPRPIVDKLNKMVNDILKEPKMRELIIDQANEPLGGTPEEFAKLIASESVKWAAVVKQGNIKP
jgi:tripartite-type tricarboxylate transporter receptor subunit TctC